MKDHLDLTDLRSMTDGDKEMELMLFQEFYSSAEKAIQLLASHCADSANGDWCSNAHAFKGIAYNLGAKALGDLCKSAQEIGTAPSEEKRLLLEAIKKEYEVVKGFLQTVHQ